MPAFPHSLAVIADANRLKLHDPASQDQACFSLSLATSFVQSWPPAAPGDPAAPPGDAAELAQWQDASAISVLYPWKWEIGHRLAADTPLPMRYIVIRKQRPPAPAAAETWDIRFAPAADATRNTTFAASPIVGSTKNQDRIAAFYNHKATVLHRRLNRQANDPNAGTDAEKVAIFREFYGWTNPGQRDRLVSGAKEAPEMTWRSFLGAAATQGASIPYLANLNLCFFSYLKELVPGWGGLSEAERQDFAVLAAPMIVIKANGATQTYTPSTDIADVLDMTGQSLSTWRTGNVFAEVDQRVFAWKYVPDGAAAAPFPPAIHLFIRPVFLERLAADSPGGAQTSEALWIPKNEAYDDILAGSWQAEFPDRAAKLFDLADLMITYAGQRLANYESTTAQPDLWNEELTRCNEMILCALRDLACCGQRGTPENDTLLELALKITRAVLPEPSRNGSAATGWDKDFEQGFKHILDAYDSKLTLTKWKEDLLAKHTSFRETPTGSSDDITAFWRGIYGELADSKVLPNIVHTQWEAAWRAYEKRDLLPQDPDPLREQRCKTWEKHQGRLREALDVMTCRSVLASSVLSFYWDHILEHKPTQPPDQRKDIATNLRNALQTYALARLHPPNGPAIPAPAVGPAAFHPRRETLSADPADPIPELTLPKVEAFMAELFPPSDQDKVEFPKAEPNEKLKQIYGNDFKDDVLLQASEQEPVLALPSQYVTAEPHAISFQINPLGSYRDDEQNTEHDPDSLRQRAGICVFMRKIEPDGTTGKWRTLNAGQAYWKVPQAGGNSTDQALIETPMVIPYRMGYGPAGRDVSVAYDNRPLISRNPAEEHLPDNFVTYEGKANGEPSEDPLDTDVEILYRVPPTPTDSDKQMPEICLIPGLKVRSKYQIVICDVLLGGIGPKEVVGSAPYELTPDQLALDAPTLTKLARECTYQRRVPVGIPRFQVAGNRQGMLKDLPSKEEELAAYLKQFLPEIPSSVRPLAREFPERVMDFPPQLVDQQPRLKAEDTEVPLLMLWDPKWNATASRTIDTSTQSDRFHFQIRPPSVSLGSWDRWVNGAWESEDWAGTAPDALRSRVRGAIATRRKSAETLPGSMGDQSLDEPALVASGSSPLLHVRLRKVYPEESETVYERTVAFSAAPYEPHANDPLKDDLPKLQRKPIDIEILRAPVSVPSISSEIDPLTIKIPLGEVWELQLFTPVPESHFTPASGPAAFHPALKCFGVPKTLAPAGGTPQPYRLLSPFRLLIETAISFAEALKLDATIPGDDEAKAKSFPLELIKRTERDMHPSVSKKEVRILWQRPFNPNERTLNLVSSISLTHQLWRWNGLLQSAFPFGYLNDIEKGINPGQNTPLYQDLLKWEVPAFAGRSNLNAEENTTDIPLRAASPLPLDSTGQSEETSEERYQKTELLTDPIGDDQRLLYYRYSVVAHSRYGGLFADGEDPSVPTPGPNDPAIWKRLAKRLQLGNDKERSDSVPMPAIKFLLPLTDSHTEDDDKENPWGTPGILVVLNEPWYAKGGPAEHLLARVATAPRIYLDKDKHPPEIGPDPILSTQGWDDTAHAAQVGWYPLEDALGHTHDRNAKDPKWVRTSFVLRPPVHAPTDLSWHFVKLEFARALGEVNPAGDQQPPVEDLLKSNRLVRSKTTSPYWVQMTPDTSALSRKLPKGMQFKLEGSEQTRILSLFQANGEALPLEATSAGESFRYWIIATEPIQDDSGYQAERYFGLFEVGDTAPYRMIDMGQASTNPEVLRLRLIEVQVLRQRSDDGKPRDWVGPEITFMIDPDPDIQEQINPWTAIFGPDDLERLPVNDAVARITGISKSRPATKLQQPT